MISEQIKYEYMRRLLLGKTLTPEERAVSLAYNDVKRTFRFKGKDPSLAKEKVLVSLVACFIGLRTRVLFNMEDCPNETLRQIEYDAKMKFLMDKVCNIFKSFGFECYYGQAQKIVNMALKYLLIFSNSYDFFVPYMHIPVDNIMYNITDELKIPRAKVAWSRMNEDNYIEYQKAIREYLKDKGIKPIEWEFKNWLEENQNIWEIYGK